MSDTLNSTLHLKSFIFLLLKELEAFLFLFLFLSLLFIFIFKDFWSIAFSYVKIIIYCQRNVLFSSFCLKFTLITELIFSAEQTTFVDLTWFANASLEKKKFQMKIIFSFFDSLYHCKRELFLLFHKNKRIFIKKTLKQD